MTNEDERKRFREELERILGGKIEQLDERIPGTYHVEGEEVVYFSDDGSGEFSKQFHAVTSGAKAYVKYGAVVQERCRIFLPDGLLFYCFYYRAFTQEEMDGYRKLIEENARKQHRLLGRIEGEHFVLSDGRVFPLKACKVEFY